MIIFLRRMIVMQLRDIMSNDVLSISADDSLINAARTMNNHNIGSLPVTNQDGLVGILTDRDIVIRSVSSGMDSNQPVSMAMTNNVISGTPDMDVAQAADLMASQQIRRLPVLDGGKLVGYVSLGDISAYANSRTTSSALQEISRLN